jgi:bifunctional UDP-N-acetylglucosamine pyrophosphorylase/glucosamine-1-phosphate N-acetyltransferase
MSEPTQPKSETSETSTSAIIMAAGQGTRMKSRVPKVLHTVAGRPIVYYPVRAALDAGCAEVVVVVGHGRDLVTAYLTREFGDRVRTAVQEEQKGTGDATRAGLAAISPKATHVLVCNGDIPLLVGDDLVKVLRAKGGASSENAVALATCDLDDPTGYGRVLRNAAGEILEIREHRDLKTEAEKQVREINPGIYLATAAFFREAIAALRPNNAQGELYLTDVVAFARTQGKSTVGVPSRAEVLVGINDRNQLVEAETAMYERIARSWRAEGATVRPGARIDEGVVLAEDVTIESGACLRGATRIGRGSVIDVGCVLSDALIGEDVVLRPYSVVTSSRVEARAQIGPFSHLRPESVVGEEAHVGNFVETKKTRLGKGAKANHLSYLGDGVIGKGANIGAGTIFCNYDGFNKHTTVIGEGAFIGSDSQLVAPVTVGDGAYVATGTTITLDVPKGALALSRVRQVNKEGYADRLKARFRAAKEAAKKSAESADTPPKEQSEKPAEKLSEKG